MRDVQRLVDQEAGRGVVDGNNLGAKENGFQDGYEWRVKFRLELYVMNIRRLMLLPEELPSNLTMTIKAHRNARQRHRYAL